MSHGFSEDHPGTSAHTQAGTTSSATTRAPASSATGTAAGVDFVSSHPWMVEVGADAFAPHGLGMHTTHNHGDGVNNSNDDDDADMDLDGSSMAQATATTAAAAPGSPMFVAASWRQAALQSLASTAGVTTGTGMGASAPVSRVPRVQSASWRLESAAMMTPPTASFTIGGGSLGGAREGAGAATGEPSPDLELTDAAMGLSAHDEEQLTLFDCWGCGNS